jgi:hypothetical protein
VGKEKNITRIGKGVLELISSVKNDSERFLVGYFALLDCHLARMAEVDLSILSMIFFLAESCCLKDYSK